MLNNTCFDIADAENNFVLTVDRKPNRPGWAGTFRVDCQVKEEVTLEVSAFDSEKSVAYRVFALLVLKHHGPKRLADWAVDRSSALLKEHIAIYY